MPTELPIACTLSAAEMPARLEEISALGARLLSRDDDGRRVILRFRSDGDTRGRLQTLVAAESRCCAFLELTLSDDDEAISLTILAPEGTEEALGEFAGAFARG
jgi:hypothetical protein